MVSHPHLAKKLGTLYRDNSGKVLATLVRLIGDWDLAEEAMHESFATAIEQWTEETIPRNPTAWLISTARFKAIDIIRRAQRFHELQPDIASLLNNLNEYNEELAQQDIEDDQLRLIFACCHPAIDPKIQVPLTLREVCGLTTEEIASAFLISPSTLAQRIVRGKRKIKSAGIPFSLPTQNELSERLDAVLNVIYLVFNEGYSASSGNNVMREELSEEAIRLTRLLRALQPDPEVSGLLALMLLHESRRNARSDDNGDIVLLEDQNRALWKQDYISEGLTLIEEAVASRRLGVYTIQAAIAAEHAKAPSARDTDWKQIATLYTILMQLEPSPVVELNRAVAIAMRDGAEAGLRVIDAIPQKEHLKDYHLYHATRGELLHRAGRQQAAQEALQQALALAKQEPERRLLKRKILRNAST